MNKNNIAGFALIGLIIIGFTWYNGRNVEQQRKLQLQRDSVAMVEQARLFAEQRRQDSIAAQAAPVTTPQEQKSAAVETMGDSLANATDGEEIFHTLENELIKLTFSNKGGRVYSAEIKGYQTYDSIPVTLFSGPQNDFSLHFFTKQQLSPGHFFFRVTDASAADTSRLAMRLHVSETAYIEYIYTLAPNSYRLGLHINLVGLDKEIPRNATAIDLHWSADLRRQEKDFANESNYSTVAYKYPGEKEIETLSMRSAAEEAKMPTKVEWIAFKEQFFSAALVAGDNFIQGQVSFNNYPETHPDRLLMHCDAMMQLAYNNAPQQAISLELFFMPNQYNVLKEQDHHFEKLVNLGWWIMGYINRWLIIPTFDFLSQFISNYGIIILLLTLFIKIILLPLTHKSHVSTAKMKVLKPEIDKINQKYPKKEDAMKKQQETMALYKKTGVNIMGGCLPMLLQMPILIAMFNFFPASFELRQKSFLWADDLSTYDSVLDLPFNIPFYGDHVSLFVLLMAVSMFFYSRATLSQTPSSTEMPGMKFMQLYFMPLFLLIMFNSYSSGLSYYFMLSNFITIGQTWIIRKWLVNEDELLRKMKERAAQPQKKSKFQQRLEEMARQQQQKQQQQKRK